MISNNMSRDELISYLTQFVDAIEHNWELSEEEAEFVDLHKKIIAELSRGRIYKVSNIEAVGSISKLHSPKEYNVRYFASLSAAKRELRQRAKELSKHPFVARPDEVAELGIDRGIAPSLTQSIVTNADIQIPVPGRFKIYEIRMLQKRQIVPVQFVLTSINVAASGPEKTKKKSRNTHSSAEAEKRGIIIPFPNMEKS